jgi:hypothetical protein
MADQTSTVTYDQVGIREDLSDSIWDISPEEVPFSSNCKRVSVDNTNFEWQTDSLADVSADTAEEGADATFSAASPTKRLNNFTEIIEKTAMTSGSLEATDRAGRAREMAYQIVKRGKEIKRDFEHHLVGLNRAKDAGGSDETGLPPAGQKPPPVGSLPGRVTASYQTWMGETDFGTAGDAGANRGTGGVAPVGSDGSAAATDGTQRAFTEEMLGNVIDAIYTEGGNPNIIMANTFNKRKVTGFSGNASETNLDRSDKKVINAVSVYQSDYGEMRVVPNRFLRARDVLVYEQGYWMIGTLRGMKNTEIAKTGDAEKRQVLMEAGLCANNAASSGIIADLTTS